MQTKLLVALASVGLCCAPLATAADSAHRRRARSDDMRRAIEFERAKDRADARQARREARHPSVTYSNNTANRTDESSPTRRTVRDPGERDIRRDK